MIDSFWQDVRYAYRSLARRPAFAIGAMAILALGLGAVTAGFSVANWLILRPVPGVQDDGRLGTVWFGEWSDQGGVSPHFLSDLEYADIAPGLTAFSGFAGYQSGALGVSVAAAPARRLDAEFVTANYAEVLGASPQLGRWFAPQENRAPQGAAVAVVSDRLWRVLMNRDADVLGRTVQVNGRAVTVIGVMAPAFHGAGRDAECDLWLPGNTEWSLRHLKSPANATATGVEGFYQFVGRLRRGATFAEAEAQLHAASRRLANGPQRTDESAATADFKIFPGIGLFALARDRITQTVRLVVGVAALLLLLACANVANLLLFRGFAARGELAVRRALGASFGRLARQQITGALVLGLGGGAAGTLLALWFLDLFSSLRSDAIDASHVTLDWRVVVFALLAAIVTGAIAGLVPAWDARRTDFLAAIKGSGPTESGRRAPLRRTLATVQIAISLVLLVGALLFIRTLQRLSAINLGFDPAAVTTFTANPREHGYSAEQVSAYWREFMRRLEASPGVVAVAVAHRAPLLCCGFSTRIREAGAGTQSLSVGENQVSPSYFATLGIRVVRGSAFVPADSAQDVVVVSRTLARRLFGADDPVGRFVETPTMTDQGRRFRIIGVVNDVRYTSIEGDPEPFVYRPLREYRLSATMLVRSTDPRTTITTTAERVAAEIDPALPIFRVSPLTMGIAAALSERRLFARLLSILAVLALLLSAAGLYSLVAFGVESRTREFGIRVALGAAPNNIRSLVLREGLLLTGIGLSVGVTGATFATRLISNRLYGVSPLDPLTYVVAVMLLAGAALAASLLPARRATKVDPMTALRTE